MQIYQLVESQLMLVLELDTVSVSLLFICSEVRFPFANPPVWLKKQSNINIAKPKSVTMRVGGPT